MHSSSPWSREKTSFYVMTSLPAVPDCVLPESQRWGKSQWAQLFPPFIFSHLSYIAMFLFFFCCNKGTDSFARARCKRPMSIHSPANIGSQKDTAKKISPKVSASFKHVRFAVNMLISWAPAIGLSPTNHDKFVQDGWKGNSVGHQKFKDCRSSACISSTPVRAAERSPAALSDF